MTWRFGSRELQLAVWQVESPAQRPLLALIVPINKDVPTASTKLPCPEGFWNPASPKGPVFRLQHAVVPAYRSESAARERAVALTRRPREIGTSRALRRRVARGGHGD